MKDQDRSRQLRAWIVKGARKYKPVRYGVIAVLAVWMFFSHLLKYGKAEWKPCLAAAVSGVMLLAAVPPQTDQPQRLTDRGGAQDAGRTAESKMTSRQGQGSARKASGRPEEADAGVLAKEAAQETGEAVPAGAMGGSASVAPHNQQAPDTAQLSVETISDGEAGLQKAASGDEQAAAGQPHISEETGGGAEQEVHVYGVDTDIPIDDLLEPDGHGPSSDADVSQGDLGQGPSGGAAGQGDSGQGPSGGSVSQGDPGQPGGDDSSNERPDVSGGDEENSWQPPLAERPEEGQGTDGEAGGAEEQNPDGKDVSAGDSAGETLPDVAEPGWEARQPLAEILSRNGGTFADGVFVAGAGAYYEVAVSGSVSVSGGDSCGVRSLNYRIGETEYTAETVNGTARIDIPENISAALEIYCVDELGAASAVLREYILSESSLPEIDSQVEWKDNGDAYVHVELKDGGDVQSGIREYSCTLDGSQVAVSYGGQDAQWIQLTESIRSIAGVSFDLPLTDKKEHELVVTAVDYAGNTAREVFTVSAVPQDVISVVVPTSFDITMFKTYDGSEALVQGEDIVLCNKSGFPVNVSVKSVEIKVNEPEDAQGRKKTCKLNIGLLQAGREEYSEPLAEGETRDVLNFTLAEGKQETDPGRLVQTAQNSMRIGQVASPDYAAVRMYGTASDADWKSGDMKVRIVFDFARLSGTNGGQSGE